jgi:hypothetical protein
MEKSEGSFLWSGFVIEEFRKKITWSEIDLAMEYMPNGLTALYCRMIDQIEGCKRADCKRLLQIVLLALGRITVPGLVEIFKPAKGNVANEQALRDRIIWCNGLLKIVHDPELKHEFVEPVHLSIKDFLVRKDRDVNADDNQLVIKEEEGNLQMANICVAYLPIVCQKEPYTLKTVPFAGCAIQHWGTHARLACGHAKTLIETYKPFFDLRSEVLQT